jgi:hypothetical protein
MNETALAAMSVSDLGGMLRGRAISATELLDSTPVRARLWPVPPRSADRTDPKPGAHGRIADEIRGLGAVRGTVGFVRTATDGGRDHGRATDMGSAKARWVGLTFTAELSVHFPASPRRSCPAWERSWDLRLRLVTVSRCRPGCP